MRWGAPYFRWRRAGPVRRQSAASHDRPARTGATWPAYRGAAVVVAGVADGEDVDQAVVAGRGRERVNFRHAVPSVRGEEARLRSWQRIGGYEARRAAAAVRVRSQQCVPQTPGNRAVS
jgi:hypothetical protein